MISAGESSGEIHGAALMEAARARGLDWSFYGLGGDRMAAAGARLLAHVRETAVMGLTEVLTSAGRILAIRRSLRRSLERERPSALVLIDAPDFNFNLARAATALGIPVIYYICPQVWAWRPGRLKFLAAHTRRRAVLFEFEKKFYEERGVSADWVGHPILDELPSPAPRDILKNSLGFDPARRLLALLPGSRRQVAERLAPVFFETAAILLEHDQNLELALPRADTLAGETLGRLVAQAPALVQQRLRIFTQKSHQILGAADLALVASGTASVEATFLSVPQVVAYQASPLSFWLARRLVTVPYVTIANLVAGREVAPEFLQERATAANLAGAAWPLLAGGLARARMVDDLGQVRRQLGEPGASGRVLDILAEELAAGGGQL
jgi:lipid-A-disaccharide synthase